MRLLRIPLCLAAVLCSACQLRLAVDVDVNRNGGGTVAVAVAADAELLELAQEADADPLGDLVAAAESLREQGWTVTDATDDDGARTVTLSAAFDDEAEFEQITSTLSSTLAADEVDLLEAFTMTLSEDRVAIAGGASAQPRQAVRDYGLTRGEAVRLIERSDAFTYEVAVRLPGEVLESNATDSDAQEQRWVVEPGQRVSITAASSRPEPPILRAVLGGLGGAVVAGVALWLVARRRRA